MAQYKIETHLHTAEGSKCGWATGCEQAEARFMEGYSTIIVTDHFFRGNTRPERSLPWEEYVEQFCSGYEHAKARGAKILAEVVGYGNTSDAYHITAPDPEGDGAVRAIRMAVKEAGIGDGDEIYVNAHGTGTHLNDAMETKALKKVFGEKAYELHVSSTKSMTGHMMGATGAVEAIASVLALSEGTVPPTINYREKDEECDLDYTPNTAVKAALTCAISTSLGFGGHNACIAFRKM